MSIEFNIKKSTTSPDITIIKPSSFAEARGEIWTSYNNDLDKLIGDNTLYFNHDKFSISNARVLRGIHGDNKSWKLVSCVHGSIMQVVVDMRPNSNTYLKWESFHLDKDNRLMILIPPGFGNAFYVKSDSAIYHYKLAYKGNYIDAEDQFTVAWDDNRLNIPWPDLEPILSNRDKEARNGNH